jgi:hypothetical protein
MSPMRFFVVLLLCLTAASEASAQTILFRGRLVHVDGLSTANVTVGFGAFGSTAVRGNGQFETALPADTRSVTIEILDRDWAVLYPRSGQVSILADPQAVIEIVVGESVEAATLRLFAERHEKLAAGLEEVGAEQDEIRDILQSFVDEVTERLDVNADSLAAEIESERQRLAHYPALSETVSAYVLAARDFNLAFTHYGHAAFDDQAAYMVIYSAIDSYNQAFQKLNNERMAFEYQVAAYWESEELRSDLRALFDFALGEIHDIRILPLNETVATMREAAYGSNRDRAAISAARERIARTVEELDLRLPELERRAERVLGYLSRS